MLEITKYIDDALELSSFSFFTSKAQQKLALGYLNRAYECARKTMVHKGLTPQERWLESYDLPFDLCHVREKHRPLMQHLSMDCELVFKLVEYRKQFKEFDIVKPTKKDNDLATFMKIVNDTVGYTGEYPEEAKRNLEHYIGKELFKRVSYTWHFVTNSHDTKFIRVFWFLDRKLTKLSTILAMRG